MPNRASPEAGQPFEPPILARLLGADCRLPDRDAGAGHRAGAFGRIRRRLSEHPLRENTLECLTQVILLGIAVQIFRQTIHLR